MLLTSIEDQRIQHLKYNPIIKDEETKIALYNHTCQI